MQLVRVLLNNIPLQIPRASANVRGIVDMGCRAARVGKVSEKRKQANDVQCATLPV